MSAQLRFELIVYQASKCVSADLEDILVIADRLGYQCSSINRSLVHDSQKGEKEEIVPALVRCKSIRLFAMFKVTLDKIEDIIRSEISLSAFNIVLKLYTCRALLAAVSLPRSITVALFVLSIFSSQSPSTLRSEVQHEKASSVTM